MSALKVEVVEIQKVENHHNADRLEVAYCWDWPIVVAKGRYKAGDFAIYVPIDSILSPEVENKLFPMESAIKLRNSRIRAIKIRKQISQGMIIDPKDVEEFVAPDQIFPGNDVAAALKITKYEPQEEAMSFFMKVMTPKKIKPDIKAFKKYSDVEHGKYYGHELTLGEQVVIATKLHGSSARFGWFPSEANTKWQKIKKFFGLLPKWTFAWGSRNVQIQAKLVKVHPGCQVKSQGINFGDVYTKMVHQYDLKNRIPKGMAIYGEIIGDGIQSGYLYGCQPGEHKLFLYDIMKDGKWLNYFPLSEGDDSFTQSALNVGVPTVPIVYHGHWAPEKVEEFINVNPISDETNEGVVVRPEKDRIGQMGRVLLKFVSDAYYLNESNTDFH